MDSVNLTKMKHANISTNREENFERIFHSFYPRLYKYARLFFADRSVAEDVTQECFIQFWNKNILIKGDEEVGAYLFRMLKNHCINTIRNKKVFISHLENIKTETESQHLYEIDFLGEKQPPLHMFLYQEVLQSMYKLPRQCQNVFILNKIEGKTQKEISEELNISIKAVERHINKAKSKIKTDIHSNYPELISLFVLYWGI